LGVARFRISGRSRLGSLGQRPQRPFGSRQGCEAGFVRRQRGRELAGECRVRFGILRAAHGREPPFHELPHHFFAARDEAPFIAVHRFQLSKRRGMVRKFTHSNPGHQRALRILHPPRVKECGRNPGRDDQLRRIRVGAGDRAGKLHGLLVECGIRDRAHAQTVPASIAAGARLAFRRFRSLLLRPFLRLASRCSTVLDLTGDFSCDETV
jgi:hypothetical protein